MTPRLRTEIYPPAYKQCYVCRKPTLLHELVGRPVGVSTTRVHNLFGIQVAEYRTTQMVDICPTCDMQQIEWEQARRRQTVLGVSSVGLVLFGWQYVGLVSLIPAVVVVLFGACRWRKSRALVQRGAHDE